METVSVRKRSGRSWGDVLDELFEPFGGVTRQIPAKSRVLVKPNAIHFSRQTYTDADVLDGLLAYLRDHGYGDLAVMENATGGNFTRLVFHVIGYTRICRRYGAEPIYLDESPPVPVRLRGEEEPTRVPRRLYRELIENREGRFYLSLPKLKTHSMATVTLGVKNQQAFPVHADRMHRHYDETLARRLASLFDWVRPDFTIIEGTNAIIHGHFPTTALLDESMVPMDLLIGGKDTLAVDTIGARILGWTVDEIDHLRICREWGLGEGDLATIDVAGESLDSFTEKYPCTMLERFNPDVMIVEGKKRACIEGCRNNSLCILEMLSNDYPNKGGWTLVYGKGIVAEEMKRAIGDILVVGPCAVKELRNWLPRQFPGRTFYFVNEHNDLMTNARYQAKLSGLSPLKMSPTNPLVSGWLLFLAKLHRTTARVPPLLG